MLRAPIRFLRAKDGIAGVEFAFVAPIMVAMFFGMLELSRALTVTTDVSNMASTGADLIAAESTVSSTDLTNVYNALTAMLYPNDTTGATITITSVIDGGTGKAPVVDWSCTYGGTAQSKGSAPTTAVPAGLITAGGGGSVIWTTVTYPYTSPSTMFLKGSNPGTPSTAGKYTFTYTFYEKPRRKLQIAAPDKCP